MRFGLEDLQKFARELRGDIVAISNANEVAHLASCLSCVDILVAAYWGFLNVKPDAVGHPDRDRFILSKGHAAMALYSVLAKRGFIPSADLQQVARDGSHYLEHPPPGRVPGVELATGSLGHGLGVGTGLALAARLNGQTYRTMVVMSDGEMNEGSVWEAAMFAAAQKLDRLVAVVDFNGWQATGRSRNVLALEPLADKWRAFGWTVEEVNGHDIEALGAAFSHGTPGGPHMVLAHTVKGKGVSFMEDDNNWHYRIPTAAELASARRELGLP